MRILYDPAADAMYIRFSDASYSQSEEVQEDVILDVDASGAIGGIELLNVSQRIPQLNSKEFKFEIAGEKQ